MLHALAAEAGERARRFQPARTVRAHLLDRLGRKEEAVAAYHSAISLTHDAAERRYLEQCRDRAALIAGGFAGFLLAALYGTALPVSGRATRKHQIRSGGLWGFG